MTIAVVAVVITLTQIVAWGTLADLPASRTPLADSARLFLGGAGAAMITIGAVFSTSGNNMGGALSGSRNLFALAEHGDVPAFFARIHPRLRTPVNAILVTAGISLILALSGTFQSMAQASAISRLVIYTAACASALRLRHRRFVATVNPARFTLPFGPVIPAAAIAISLTILAGATRVQLRNGLLALAAGAVLYLIASSASSARDRSSAARRAM
jgi:amino acid transporter